MHTDLQSCCYLLLYCLKLTGVTRTIIMSLGKEVEKLLHWSDKILIVCGRIDWSTHMAQGGWCRRPENRSGISPSSPPSAEQGPLYIQKDKNAYPKRVLYRSLTVYR